MWKRSFVALLKVVFFPLSLPWRILEEGRWRRRQRRGMVMERPPLADAEFLRVQDVSESDATLWPAVRRCMAEACGLPSEAVRPQDRVADLFRMQWMGPDALDIVFRLERSLAVKIPRVRVEEAFSGARMQEFGPFAAELVRVLRDLPTRER